MIMLNAITKSMLELEASVLENYKYANEGTSRTPGSDILTHTKSLITLADKDPEMFRVKSIIFTGTIISAVAVGVIGTTIYFKVKERTENNKEKENI